jgi:hypothetical protein
MFDQGKSKVLSNVLSKSIQAGLAIHPLGVDGVFPGNGIEMISLSKNRSHRRAGLMHFLQHKIDRGLEVIQGAIIDNPEIESGVIP